MMDTNIKKGWLDGKKVVKKKKAKKQQLAKQSHHKVLSRWSLPSCL